MIDTHCHIYFDAYDNDREEVLLRARAKHVRMIFVGTDEESSAEAIRYADSNTDIWATVGFHPNYLHAKNLALSIDRLRKLIDASSRVVAIGEIGLDYYRLPEEGKNEAIEHQKNTLKQLFALATECRLPVVLHVRDAHADMLQILQDEVDAGNLPRRGVVHCFSGTLTEARAYHMLGFFTSFTGIVTFKDKKNPDTLTDLQTVVVSTPLDRFMCETDAPYLTPVPHRGERNEPAHVQFVIEEIARLKGITPEEVNAAATSNAQQLFNITL